MTTELEARVQESHDAQAPERPEPLKMFTFSRWIHLGEGAEECPDAETGDCSDPEHFHAWLRLPNKLQRKDLEEEASAARARHLRLLRDPESKTRGSLDEDIHSVVINADDEFIARRLIGEDWGKDYLQATAEVREDKDEEYEHLDRDRIRYQELFELHGALDKDEWPEELLELDAHIRKYLEDVNERVRVIQEPKLRALIDRGREALIELLREKQIAAEGDKVYAHTYNVEEWLMCTYRTPGRAGGRRRVWASAEEMHDAPPEVIEELERVFNELEVAFHRGAMGNS